MDKINQIGELTVFKWCSHRSAKGEEREELNHFQILSIPTATNTVLAYRKLFKTEGLTEFFFLISSCVCGKGSIKTAAPMFYASVSFYFDFKLNKEQ